MAVPRDIIEEGYIKLYKAPLAVVTEIFKVILGILAFWVLKDWLFTKIYELSGWLFAKDWASVSFLFWPTVIIGGLIILNLILTWLFNCYEVFPDRVVIKSGILSRTQRSIDMDQFAAVSINQGMWGRLLGYGDIVFMFEAMTTIVAKQGVVFSKVRQPLKLVQNAAKYIAQGKAQIRGTATDKQGLVTKDVVEKDPVSEEKTAEITEPPKSSEVEVPKASEPIEEQTKVKPNEPVTIQGEIDFSKHE